MSLEFTKLSEVATADSTTGSAKMLVEDGGEVKRLDKLANEMLPEGYPYMQPKGGTETISEWSGEITALGSGLNRGPSLNYADVLTEELIIGETYVVTYDGTDYECVCFGAKGSANRPTLGNTTWGDSGEDEQGKGEPFLLTKLVNYFFCYSESAGEHSYAIKKYVPAPVPMDEKFLPYANAPIADTLSEEANVLIEDGGEVKRVAKSKVGGGGASSWNDLTDKPFYTEYETIVEQGTYATIDNEGSWAIPFDMDVELVSGETYSIHLDGIDYSCPVKYLSFASMYFLGNAAAFGVEGTGEPFTIVAQPGILGVLVLADTAATEHTFGMKKESKVVKIPEAYYDKYVGFFYNGSDEYIYTDNACTEKVTLDQFKEAVSNNMIRLNFWGDEAGYLLPIMVLWDGATVNGVANYYGVVKIVSHETDGSISVASYYTAEYTGA